MSVTFTAAPRIEFGDHELDGSISQRFERIVASFPEHLAVVHGAHKLSYADLNSAANRIAHLILALTTGPDAPVVLLMDNDLAMFGAVLGVLKAGRAYCAFDPSFPISRSSFMIDDLQSQLILTDTANLAHAQQLAGDALQVVNIATVNPALSSQNPQIALTPDTLAAIYYTSGSTGTPKGVERTHINMLHRCWIMEQSHPAYPGDVMSMLYPCSVGASISDFYVGLLSGATLAIYDLKRLGAGGLADWLINQQVTRLHLHTSVLRDMLDSLPADATFPSLRYVRPSDRLYRSDVERLWRVIPTHAKVVHGLASTEAGMITMITLDRDTLDNSEIVPMGYPVPGVELLLLDDDGASVPPGEVGEITVRSRFMARGYWRRPEFTAERFQADPVDGRFRIYKLGDLGRMRTDGCLELVGRKDQMVKVRGNRVELAEIEAALERLALVQRAAVVVRPNRTGEQVLIAYVLPADPALTTAAMLRQHLRQALPTYMMPSRIVIMESLPILANGKVDRQALPPAGSERPDIDTPYEAPRTPVEDQVAAIWADVLGLDCVGVHDSFLDLGGHSLQAARIVSRVMTTFQVDLPLSVLFSAPTVADMTLAVTQQQAARLDPAVLEVLLTELDATSNPEHD
jgi:amino acid adenylation domain-containing protein